jgi:hypothetical protein
VINSRKPTSGYQSGQLPRSPFLDNLPFTGNPPTWFAFLNTSVFSEERPGDVPRRAIILVLWILRASDFPLVASPALNFLIDHTAAQEPHERARIHSAADRWATI